MDTIEEARKYLRDVLQFPENAVNMFAIDFAEFAEHCKQTNLPSDEADIRAVLIDYTEAIREYIRESHNLICFDERENEEFVDIFLQNNSVKPEPKEPVIPVSKIEELVKKWEAKRWFDDGEAKRHSECISDLKDLLPTVKE